MAHIERAFSALPIELFLHILDLLIDIDRSQRPVAHPPSHSVTKTLRALALVSHTIYPFASRYLYAHCVYIDSCTSLARFRRTLGLDLGVYPQALRHGKLARNDALFPATDALRHLDSFFLSPCQLPNEPLVTPMTRLPQIIDVCGVIGRQLKRMILDLTPVYTPPSEIETLNPHFRKNNIFSHMHQLEELTVSFDVIDYFPFPPPNLKRLATTAAEMLNAQSEFCFSISSLESLVFLRPPELTAADIDALVETYKGNSLDIVLVDVNSNHRTPSDTRSWNDHDTVRIWEADVPTSFYGDENDLILCDNWIWTHALDGTIWTGDFRRMASWADVKKRLDGPVHQLLNATPT